MLQIMVYHKELEQVQLLCKLVTAYFRKVRHSYKMVAYTKWEDAAKHLQEAGSKDDVVFLDCSELKRAFALAKLLRARNTEASWVYVGPDLEGLCAVLLMRPSAYVADFSQTRQVLLTIQRLDTYHQELHRKNDFLFKCDGEYVRIPYHDICYFESSAKKVTLHLLNSDRTYCFSAKLDDIEKMLPGFFLRCHQSFLVNLRMVRHLDSKNHVFVLHSMDEVLISRRNYTAAKEAYQSFLEAQKEYAAVTP